APVQRLYDLKQAAQYLGRPVWGVRELIWSGKLPVIQDGRKMYVDLYDMDRYIELEKTTLI
ncbi:MAG: helix-turn-helix domain-containing protein, partial [Desulfobacteraceae bacterium]|nr:helix-turn-helix domain-containing protein [Desulfobacteraceae bacterium]